MIVRICTENKNGEWLRETISKYFDCFNLTYGMGVWKGQPESSITIDLAFIYFQPDDSRKIDELVTRIKEHNAQEKILVEYIASNNILV